MIRTLTGTNTFALSADLERITRQFTDQYGVMALEKIDCQEAEYSRITEAVQSLPFLSSKKMVVLNQPGTQKQFVESLEHIIESISDSTDVLIIEPKPDKRSSYYKTLQKKTEFKSYDQMSPRELATWLSQQASIRGGSLRQADAQYLVERVGANQQLLSNELDKLLIYEPRVSKQTIDLLTEPTLQSTVFQLLDAAFSGDAKRTIELYNEQRAQKVEPAQILALLAWQLHILALTKTAGDLPAQAIASEAGLSPFAVQKSQSVTKKLTMGQVKDMVRDLHILDIKMKSTAIDPDEAMEQYLLTIVM